MGAAFTESVTDGIGNRRSDKYYFPLLKVATLLLSTVIREPVLWGDGILMSECVCGKYLPAVSAQAVQLLCGGWV